jgi:hypothetical protein
MVKGNEKEYGVVIKNGFVKIKVQRVYQDVKYSIEVGEYQLRSMNILIALRSILMRVYGSQAIHHNIAFQIVSIRKVMDIFQACLAKN